MAAYVILSSTYNEQVKANLKRAYPITSTVWAEGIFFLLTKDSPGEVGDKIDVVRNDGDVRKSGTLSNVLILTVSPPYWGASNAETWHWLGAAFEENND